MLSGDFRFCEYSGGQDGNQPGPHQISGRQKHIGGEYCAPVMHAIHDALGERGDWVRHQLHARHRDQPPRFDAASQSECTKRRRRQHCHAGSHQSTQNCIPKRRHIWSVLRTKSHLDHLKSSTPSTQVWNLIEILYSRI